MCDSGKSLFGVYNDNFIQIVSLLTTFVTNTKTFMETVKIVFKQKNGFQFTTKRQKKKKRLDMIRRNFHN